MNIGLQVRGELDPASIAAGVLRSLVPFVGAKVGVVYGPRR